MSTAPFRFATGTIVPNFDAYARWLRTAEDVGCFELLCTGDSQSLWAEPFVSMTFAALHTERCRIGIAVSNPVTRHPAVVASACVALQKISGGRFVYGISSGDSALRNIGEPPSSVAELDEYVRAVQGLTGGESVDYRGTEMALHWDHQRVPVFIAGSGPRTQRLAGRIADGVVLASCLTPESNQAALENIAEGAAEAGRSLDDIEIWWLAHVALAETEDEAIDELRFLLAGDANFMCRFHMDGKAIPEEIKPRLAALEAEYDSRHHAMRDTADANAALVDKFELRDFLARRSTIAGPTERCVERLQEIAEAGIDKLLITQFTDDPNAFMKVFADQIAARVL